MPHSDDGTSHPFAADPIVTDTGDAASAVPTQSVAAAVIKLLIVVCFLMI